jgi:DNA-binding transcriptional LysR family regulator
MKSITPADLAIFLTIANHRNFSRAAVELGISASAISHALRGIEERLDLRLFNRTTRSVALTEAGERLYSRIKPAFRDIDDAIEDLNTFRGRPAGTLRFNTALAAAKIVLLPLATRFRETHVDVNIEIVADNAMVDIVAAGFDAGVRFGETVQADMIAVPIGPRMRSAVVASPEFLARHAPPKTPHDLQHVPCIRYRFSSGVFYRWEFERGGMKVEADVQGPLTLGDMELMIDAARRSAGLAYVFEDLAAPHLASGELVRVLEDWCPFYPGFYLYYPSRRQVPAALKAFIEFVQANRAN